MYLRWLALTCDHFDRAQICPQVGASFSPFDHQAQVFASQSRQSRNYKRDRAGLGPPNLRVLASQLATPFGNPAQVNTSCHFPTCVDLRSRLAKG